MAELSNPQIVRFANERVRTMADEIVRFSRHVDEWLADYAAQGIAPQLVAAGLGSVIADGSETDGRQRIDGLKVANLRAALQQLQAAIAVTTVAGVGATAKSVADGIHVNGNR